MLDLNVTIKVPGLRKLSDVVASGVGAVAGSMLAPWMAKKQAEAKRIEAKGQSDSLHIIAQAQADARQALTAPNAVARGTLEITREQITQRLEFQENKRQQNIISVVRQAAEELGDEEVLDNEPDHDWTARFFGYVQDVSEEDVRRIWGRILAGEVRSPNGVSLRTLSVLRNMSRREAELFADAMRYRIDDYILRKFCLRSSDKLRSGDFYYRFVDTGLFYSPVGTRPPRRISLDKNGVRSMINADHILFLKGKPNIIVDGDDKVVLKTPARELAPFCDSKSDMTYLARISHQENNKRSSIEQ